MGLHFKTAAYVLQTSVYVLLYTQYLLHWNEDLSFETNQKHEFQVLLQAWQTYS